VYTRTADSFIRLARICFEGAEKGGGMSEETPKGKARKQPSLEEWLQEQIKGTTGQSNSEVDDFDWNFDLHHLSSLSNLSWDNLFRILFGLQWSQFKNLFKLPPEEILPAHLPVLNAVNDLLERIFDDCKSGKLQYSIDAEWKLEFPTYEISEWVIKKRIIPWLSIEKKIPIKIKSHKFFEITFIGYAIKNLYMNESGGIDWEHYASLSIWKWTTALTILAFGVNWNWGNYGRENNFEEWWLKVRDIVFMSLDKGDLKSFHGHKLLNEKERSVTTVDPFVFCCWVIDKGFPLHYELLNRLIKREKEKEERGDRNRQELREWLEEKIKERGDKKDAEPTQRAPQKIGFSPPTDNAELDSSAEKNDLRGKKTAIDWPPVLEKVGKIYKSSHKEYVGLDASKISREIARSKELWPLIRKSEKEWPGESVKDEVYFEEARVGGKHLKREIKTLIDRLQKDTAPKKENKKHSKLRVRKGI